MIARACEQLLACHVALRYAALPHLTSLPCPVTTHTPVRSARARPTEMPKQMPLAMTATAAVVLLAATAVDCKVTAVPVVWVVAMATKGVMMTARAVVTAVARLCVLLRVAYLSTCPSTSCSIQILRGGCSPRKGRCHRHASLRSARARLPRRLVALACQPRSSASCNGLRPSSSSLPRLHVRRRVRMECMPSLSRRSISRSKRFPCLCLRTSSRQDQHLHHPRGSTSPLQPLFRPQQPFVRTASLHWRPALRLSPTALPHRLAAHHLLLSYISATQRAPLQHFSHPLRSALEAKTLVPKHHWLTVVATQQSLEGRAVAWTR
mmetsp:Transcript_5690/g.9532  ORF Transcript_5690/g.9532 Transcript_5690/m.9532 type:complete len:322 (-) Transcript_5690:752-1717(-)